MSASSTKVVLIGWDAADWQIIEPLMERGLMPTFKKFVEEGVRGNLSTRQPPLSPILWNTIATGKNPAKHGILGFIEPNADNSGIQPVTSTSRKTKALWNIVSQNGLKSTMVGWYASHPAEPVDGAIVSDLLINTVGRDTPESSLPPQSFHPPELEDKLIDLRVFPSEIGPGHVLPFVPDAGKIPLEKTGPLSSIQQMLAKCGTTHAVFTDLLEREPWDFAAAYYETIDHFGHVFMPYHPPRMPHVPEEEFNWFRECITGVYRFHDMMLERILKLAGPDAIVLVISDHGFLNDDRRPHTLVSSENPAAWHRDHGIFAARGPGIRKGDRIEGASIIDVTPTVLTMLGLPIGQDMDGKVLLGVFDQAAEVRRLPSWDVQIGPGNAGMHPPDMRVDPFEQAASLQQLVELGYIAAPSADAGKAIADAKADSEYNLICSELEVSPRHAMELLSSMCAAHPDDERFLTLKLMGELNAGKFADAAKTLGPEGARLPKLPPEQRYSALASVAIGLKNFSEAERYLSEAEKINATIPALQMQIGDLRARRRNWSAAVFRYSRAIELDPDSAHAHFGLGRAYLRCGEYQMAVDETLFAVEKLHDFPAAHLQLGISLLHLDLVEEAVKALNIALQLRPDLLAAHRCLVVAHGRLGHAAHAKMHRDVVRRLVSMYIASSFTRAG